MEHGCTDGTIHFCTIIASFVIPPYTFGQRNTTIKHGDGYLSLGQSHNTVDEDDHIPNFLLDSGNEHRFLTLMLAYADIV